MNYRQHLTEINFYTPSFLVEKSAMVRIYLR